MDKIVMIEAGANEVDEDTMLTAIKTAHVEIKKIITFINGIVAERGKPKIDFQVVGLDMDVFHAIQNKYLDDFKAAMDTDDKNIREARWNAMIEKWHEKYLEEYPDMDQYLEEFTYKFQKKIVKAWLLEATASTAARRTRSVPSLPKSASCPASTARACSPRGQTQVLSVCTLDTLSAAQKLDTIWEETEKRYMHHYNFPQYSVGETGRYGAPGRREIGHGALGERALAQVLQAWKNSHMPSVW